MTRREHVWGLVVFALALALRLAYVNEHHRVLGLDVSELTQTDNHVFAAWAGNIADGDLLCRSQPHAYHHWTSDIAPEGRWLEWYGGATTFHQAPLYPYLVAAVYKLAGREHVTVGYAQALLSALTCWLTFLLGRRTMSLRVGVLAGLLLALCGPYVFYDAFLLRDGAMAFFVVLTTLALDRAVDLGRARDWLLAGGSLGLFTIVKETGVPLLVLTVIAVLWWRRAALGSAVRPLALVVVGWMVVTAPAFARNVAVDAPTFKLSTRGPEVFVTGNARGQDGIGWDPPTETLREILVSSNFSLTHAMALTLATHRADPWGYVELLWGKTRALFNGYEVPNNVNFYLHRSHLASLRVGFVSMVFVGPAALLGLIIGLRHRRRLAVSYLMFGAVAASIVALYILARFRLQLLPLFMLFAAVTIDWTWDALLRRRWPALVAAAVPFAIFTAWCWSDDDPYGETNKHTSVMLQLAKIRNFSQALRYRDLLVDSLGGADPALLDSSGWKLTMIQDAFDGFARAQEAGADSAEANLALGEGYALLLRPTKRGDLKDFTALAREHLNRALELDPDIVGAHYRLGRVAFEVANHPQGGSGDFGPALSRFLHELRLHPDHGPSHWEAGRIKLAWKHEASALQHLLLAEEAGIVNAELCAGVALISVNPLNRNEPPVRIGGEAVAIEDHDRALVYAERAHALDADDPNVVFALSTVYYVHGRYDESIVLLEQLIELQPWRSGELRARIDAYRGAQARRAKDTETPAESDGSEGLLDDELPPLDTGDEPPGATEEAMDALPAGEPGPPDGDDGP